MFAYHNIKNQDSYLYEASSPVQKVAAGTSFKVYQQLDTMCEDVPDELRVDAESHPVLVCAVVKFIMMDFVSGEDCAS